MGFFREHWKTLLMSSIAVFNGIIGGLSLLKVAVSSTLIIIGNFCLSVLYPIIEGYDKITEKNEILEENVNANKNTQNIQDIKEEIKIVTEDIKEQKIVREKKKEENRIVIDLINNGVISIKTLESNILDKKFISVLCYQAGFSVKNGIISEKIRDKINKLLKNKKNLIEAGIDISREYPKMFEDMGFIQLAKHNQFFIMPEDNLSPKLKDLTKLSDYLIKKGIIIVDEEWKKIKGIHKRFDTESYNQMKNKENPINFNILIMKINRRDMRHKFTLRNDFDKEFNNELSAIVNLNNFKTLHSEKVTIKTIISQSSLKILVLSLDKTDRDKILELEEVFTASESEGGLGIKNFYDYHTKNINDIKNILKKKFKTDEKINQYANLIFNNSRDFKEDLNKLGISF